MGNNNTRRIPLPSLGSVIWKYAFLATTTRFGPRPSLLFFHLPLKWAFVLAREDRMAGEKLRRSETPSGNSVASLHDNKSCSLQVI